MLLSHTQLKRTWNIDYCFAKTESLGTKSFLSFFLFLNNQSWYYAVYLNLWAWGSVNGRMTISITPKYPCLITSIELDCTWEGFSATEKIPWLGVGGGVLDGEQSCRAVVDGRVCGVWVCSSSSSFLFPSQNEPGTIGQLPKPPPDNNIGKKKKKKKWLDRRGEKEEESNLVATTVGILQTVLSWGLGNPTPELKPAGMENGAFFPRERTCQMQNNITWSLSVEELAVTHFLYCASGGSLTEQKI